MAELRVSAAAMHFSGHKSAQAPIRQDQINFRRKYEEKNNNCINHCYNDNDESIDYKDLWPFGNE